MESELRLLLVEDSSGDELALVRTLRSSGLLFSFHRATGEASFLEALSDPWDVVITDYLLPDLTADRVIDLLRTRQPHTPVLVLSGRAGEDLAVEVMRRGAADYILKENLSRVPYAVERALREVRVRAARSRAEAQVIRLGRMYRLLSETNQAIVRIPEPRALLEEVCRLACRQGPFELVRVTRCGQDGPEALVQAGAADRAFSQESSVLTDGRTWIDADRQTALVPLKVDGSVWGCLGFHSGVPGTFTPEESSLLQDLAEDLSFGLQARNRDLQRRETEQFLTDMANLVPGLFYKLRLAAGGVPRFEYVSPGIDLILPLSPAEVEADSTAVFGALHPADRRKFILAGRRSRRTLTVFNLEFRVLRPNGSVVWVLATAFPQPQSDGSVVWTGLAIDATPQNKLQEALQREQELLAVILDNIGDAVVAIDEAGRLAMVNRSAFQLLEKEGEIPDRWETLDPDLPWDARDRFVPWFRRRSDGAVLHLEAHATDLTDQDRNSRGRVLLIRDMTERDRIEERLRQSEKLESIGLLAGGIAHDFNNLLTGLFGFIQLAQMNAGEADKVVTYLDHALGPFQRARTLTQQLLTFAKGGEPNKVSLALPPLIRGVLGFTLQGTGVEWELGGDPHPWPIVGNEAQVHQVFENLSVNARQALGTRGGRLRVSLVNRAEVCPEDGSLTDGPYVEILVDDSGPGIPPEVLPKVFDPFFTTKPTGTGLGLSICFSVVKKHGGAIEAETSPLGGARFRILWPAGIRPPQEAEG